MTATPEHAILVIASIIYSLITSITESNTKQIPFPTTTTTTFNTSSNNNNNNNINNYDSNMNPKTTLESVQDSVYRGWAVDETSILG